MQVLIAEDDITLADALSRCLRAGGHVVHCAGDGEAALQALGTRPEAYDLLVLDYGLPRADGGEVLRRLRGHARRPPVLLISARDDALGCIERLGLSVEDHLQKPFGLDHFDERVRQLLGQRPAGFGSLSRDAASGAVRLAGADLELPDDERALLAQLFEQPGAPARRDALEQRLSALASGRPFTECLRALQARLAAHDIAIVEVRGLGYCLRAG